MKQREPTTPGEAIMAISLLAFLGWGYFAYTKVLANYNSLLPILWERGYGLYLGIANQQDFTMVRCLASLTKSACREVVLKVMPIEQQAWWFAPLLLFLLGLIIGKALDRRTYAQKDPGTSDWASKDDLKYELLHPHATGYLGYLTDGTLLQRPPNQESGHSAIFAIPGGGKSTAYFKPMMMVDAFEGNTSIIHDLKLPDTTAGFLDMIPVYAGYKRNIQIFMPFREGTMRMPILSTIHDFQSASQLAEMFIPIPKEDNSSEYYKNMERLLMTGLLLGVALSPTPSFKFLYHLLSKNRNEVIAFLKTHDIREVRESIGQSITDIKQDTLTGMLAGLYAKLAIFNNPILDRATSANPKSNADSIDIRSVFKDPSMLYIGIENDLIISGKGKVLLQLIKRYVDNIMFRMAAEAGGKLPIQTNLYYDEMVNFGYLPNFQEILNTCRSYRISYHMSFQNLAQLETVYGREESKNIRSSTANLILPPRFISGEDREYWIKYYFSYKTFYDISESTSHSTLFGKGGSKGKSVKKVERPLLDFGEMARYPKGEGVVFINGLPIQILLPRIDQSTTVRGTPNTIHQLYKPYIGQNFRDILEAKTSVKTTETVFENFTQQIDPTERLIELLQDWLSLYPGTEKGIEVRTLVQYRSGNPERPELNAVTILKKSLPEALNPTDSQRLTSAGLISETENYIKIKKPALQNLGASLLGRLILEERWGKVLLVLRREATLFENHPLRLEATSEGRLPEGQLKGIYALQSGFIYLRKDIFNKLYTKTPELPTIEKHGKTFVGIPFKDQHTDLDFEYISDKETVTNPSQDKGYSGEYPSLTVKKGKIAYTFSSIQVRIIDLPKVLTSNVEWKGDADNSREEDLSDTVPKYPIPLPEASKAPHTQTLGASGKNPDDHHADKPNPPKPGGPSAEPSTPQPKLPKPPTYPIRPPKRKR